MAGSVALCRVVTRCGYVSVQSGLVGRFGPPFVNSTVMTQARSATGPVCIQVSWSLGAPDDLGTCCAVIISAISWSADRWNRTIYTQRSHDAKITSLWRQNGVTTSFWRHNDVIIASCARREGCWVEVSLSIESKLVAARPNGMWKIDQAVHWPFDFEAAVSSGGSGQSVKRSRLTGPCFT